MTLITGISDNCFTKTGLIVAQESAVGLRVAAKVRPPFTAQSLLESLSVAMRHHIVQNRIDCAVKTKMEFKIIISN